MRRFLLLLTLGCAGLGLLGAVVGGVYWTWFLCADDACPSVAQFDEFRPVQPARLYTADGRFLTEVGLERRSVVPLADIPPHVVQAFIATEDKRFYRHGGIDYPRIVGAVWANLKARGFAEGFSTITMQLARNVFPERLSREKTILRKLREAKVARELERRLPKTRILELYLNQIAFGSGAYGVEAAAQRYFGRSVRELNVAEAAMLAALPKAPSRYNPRRFPDRAIQRRNAVLELMRRQDLLADADASVAKAYPLRLARAAIGDAETSSSGCAAS
jgi:penicillin-binding protein 1A